MQGVLKFGKKKSVAKRLNRLKPSNFATCSSLFHDGTPKTVHEIRGNGIANGELLLNLPLDSVQFKGECGASCREITVYRAVRRFRTTDHRRGDTL